MKEIEELRKILEQRRKDIVKIGKLLKEIKEKKLYREKSFSQFVRNIGISPRTASYYIKISEIEDADKLIREIGYRKLILLMEAKKLDIENINLAKSLSTSQLREHLYPKKSDYKEQIKKEIKKFLEKSGVDIFKEALIEVINELKKE